MPKISYIGISFRQILIGKRNFWKVIYIVVGWLLSLKVFGGIQHNSIQPSGKLALPAKTTNRLPYFYTGFLGNIFRILSITNPFEGNTIKKGVIAFN